MVLTGCWEAYIFIQGLHRIFIWPKNKILTHSIAQQYVPLAPLATVQLASTAKIYFWTLKKFKTLNSVNIFIAWSTPSSTIFMQFGHLECALDPLYPNTLCDGQNTFHDFCLLNILCQTFNIWKQLVPHLWCFKFSNNWHQFFSKDFENPQWTLKIVSVTAKLIQQTPSEVHYDTWKLGFELCLETHFFWSSHRAEILFECMYKIRLVYPTFCWINWLYFSYFLNHMITQYIKMQFVL